MNCQSITADERSPLLQPIPDLEHESPKVQVAETRVMRVPKVEGPDGCLAWGVAFAACLINFIMAGLGRMSGILYVGFIEMFGISRGTAMAPFAVRSSTRNLLGPVVGILGQQYGVRAVTVTGGIVGVISAAACFFAPDMTWITVIWGGINGFGTALTTTLPQVIIGQYFKKYHTTAAGLAFSGGCVGAFLFPALIEYTLHTYGLQGTFLIISGIIMHVIPAALMLKEPPWIKKEERKQSVNPSPSISTNNHHNGINGNSKLSNGIIVFKNDSELKNQEKIGLETSDFLTTELNFFNETETTYCKVLIEAINFLYASPKYFGEHCNKEFATKCNFSNNQSIVQFIRRMHQVTDFQQQNHINENEDIDRSNNISSEIVVTSEITDVIETTIEELSKESVVNDFLIYLEVVKVESLKSMTSENVSTVILKLVELHKQYKCLKSNNVKNGCLIVEVHSDANADEEIISEPVEKTGIIDNIKTALKLYTSPIFHLICLCRAIHFLTFIPVVTVVVDYGMDKGLPEADGKYIIAALSAGDLIGRIGFGWVTDGGWMDLPHYMLVVMFAQGGVTAILPLVYNKWVIYILIGLFGMMEGSVFIRHPVLVTRYMGSNEQSIAMGCINFLSGFLGFGFPAYIGYFRDTLGSYDQMFYITGALQSFVGLAWFFEPQWVRCSAKSRQSVIVDV